MEILFGKRKLLIFFGFNSLTLLIQGQDPDPIQNEKDPGHKNRNL